MCEHSLSRRQGTSQQTLSKMSSQSAALHLHQVALGQRVVLRPQSMALRPQGVALRPQRMAHRRKTVHCAPALMGGLACITHKIMLASCGFRRTRTARGICEQHAVDVLPLCPARASRHQNPHEEGLGCTVEAGHLARCGLGWSRQPHCRTATTQLRILPGHFFHLSK